MNILLNRLVLVLLALVFFAGCGGGGGGGGASSPTATAQNSFSTGAISGFGSVIVNGVHWSDDASVEITLDDDKGIKDDLRVGMVVEIEGEDIRLSRLHSNEDRKLATTQRHSWIARSQLDSFRTLRIEDNLMP